MRILTQFLLLILICVTASAKTLATKDLNTRESALYYAEKGDYSNALIAAKKNGDNSLIKIVSWMKYKANGTNASFSEMRKFITENGHWPEIGAVKANVEYAIKTQDKKTIQSWFEKYPPTTPFGKKAYALTYLNSSAELTDKQKQAVKAAFESADLTADEQASFLKSFGKYLTKQDYFNRASNMMWRKKNSQARQVMGFLDDELQKIINFRIELGQKVGTPKLLMHAAHIENSNDYGLLYDMAKYYDGKDNFDTTVKILLKAKNPQKFQDKWWSLRVKYIRELLDHKSYQKAYDIAAHANNVEDSDYAESEWLAGWIGFSFLHKPDAAYQHFYNLYKIAKFPITISRAAYWCARSNEKSKPEDAIKWYKIASKFSETFYGQLAITKLNEHHIFKLPSLPAVTEEDRAHFKRNELVRVAKIFADTGRKSLAKLFLKTAVKTSKSRGEIVLILDEASNLNKHLMVEAAKEASRKGVLHDDAAFPMIQTDDHHQLDKSFVHAIIRQESVFDPRAISHMGAMGLMQIMPKSAEELSKELKLKYNMMQFKKDYKSNIKVGSYYLSKLMNQFDNSKILTIAAYNAGPMNVRKWLTRNGDPREMENLDEVINWIEKIPFYETRNYVQRVMENIQIYRLRHGSKNLLLKEDLVTANSTIVAKSQ